MDPISAAATAVQVAAIGVEACVKLIKLIQEFRHASESIKSLVDRFTGLQILLTAFQEAWEHCKSPELDQFVKDIFQRSESSLRRLDKACDTFRKEEEEGKLQKIVQNFMRSAKYVSKKGIIDGLIQDASDFSADVGSIMQICFFRKLHGDVMNKLGDIGQKVSAIHSATEQEILKWVLKSSAAEASDYETTHRYMRKKRSASTCEWLFTTSEWSQLLRTGNSTLWVYGIAGSGKSVLCSSIIEKVSKIATQESDVACAYYYFSRAGVPQTLDSCLLSLIHQLCVQHNSIPPVLRSAYARGKLPETEELKITLDDLMQRSQRTILILDALDECTEFDNRDAVIDWLQNVRCDQSTTELNLIITSRDQPDIREVLSEIQTIEINLDHSRNRDDIRNYVQNALSDHPRLKRIVSERPSLGKEIMETLVGDANGMFLLASSRINMLRKIKGITQEGIQTALKALPKDVDGVYDQILASIPQDTRDKAVRALCWLAIARRPLTVEELAEACLLDPEVESGPLVDLDKKFIVPEEVLELIPDFVTVREIKPKHRVVQLAHATIFEYLQSGHSSSKIDLHIPELATDIFITRCCLKYVSHMHHMHPYQPLPVCPGNTSFPLQDYASTMWYRHYRLVPETRRCAKEYHDVETQVLQFFTNTDVFSTWRILHDEDDEGEPRDRSVKGQPRSMHRNGSPLYYAAFLGLPQTCIEALVEHFPLNVESGFWGTPVHAAASSGMEDITMLLLRLGADPRIPNHYYGNLLISAIKNDLPDLALHLIRNKLVDFEASNGEALHEAVRNGWNNTAKALINAGASVDAPTQPARWASPTTPLITAVLNNNCEMIKFFHYKGASLDQQLDNPGGGYHSFVTALQACSCGSKEYWNEFNLLLRLGADVNVTKGSPKAPICSAAKGGNTRALRALIDAGAEINTYYTDEANPLMVALCAGQQAAALMLLDEGAMMPGMDSDQMGRAINEAGGSSAWVNDRIRELRSSGEETKDQAPPVRSGRKPLEACAGNGTEAIITPSSAPKRPSRDTVPLMNLEMLTEEHPVWI